MADTKTTSKAIIPDLALSEDIRGGVVEVLQTVLADEFILYTKLRNYHWNVTGTHFRALHLLFEEQYTAIETTIDETAERIRTYGAKAIGTTSEFSKTSRLQEQPGEYPEARQMVANLAADHETMVRNLREDVEKMDEYDDVAGEDFLTGLLQTHQTMAWMLRSFLEE